MHGALLMMRVWTIVALFTHMVQVDGAQWNNQNVLFVDNTDNEDIKIISSRALGLAGLNGLLNRLHLAEDGATSVGAALTLLHGGTRAGFVRDQHYFPPAVIAAHAPALHGHEDIHVTGRS